jgi:hypothetical protein
LCYDKFVDEPAVFVYKLDESAVFVYKLDEPAVFVYKLDKSAVFVYKLDESAVFVYKLDESAVFVYKLDEPAFFVYKLYEPAVFVYKLDLYSRCNSTSNIEAIISSEALQISEHSVVLWSDPHTFKYNARHPSLFCIPPIPTQSSSCRLASLNWTLIRSI